MDDKSIRVKLLRRHILASLTVLLSSFYSVSAQEKTLDDYISLATSNSPLIKDMNNRVLLNKMDGAILLANYRPQIGANSTGTYAPVIRGFGYDEALSNGKTFSALVTVNQSLSGSSRMNNELQGISILSDSVTNAIGLSSKDIRRNVITQYITAFTSQMQTEFDKKVYHLLKEEEIVLKKLTQNNVYKQTDYLSFVVTLQQQEIQMKQDENAASNDIATLNYLAGIVGTDPVKLSEPGLDVKTEQQITESVFMKQFRLDSLRLENQRKVIDFNYQPRAGVYADAGYYTSFIDRPGKNFGFSAGLTISVPIYDGGQRKLQYSKLDVQENTRQNYRAYFLKQYHQQIAQLKQQLDQQEQLFAKLNEQIKFAEVLIRADGKLLQTGDVTIADYILAIRNYLDVQNTLRQTNISRLELINQLNYWTQ